MARQPPFQPNWDRLFHTAATQQGFFTTAQAKDAGYSPQLLVHHLRAGRIVRVLHGIYRLVHYPAGEHDELVTAWLWSGRTGIVSHQSALALHELSDVFPAHVHLMLPDSWRQRRLRVPPGIVLHHADVPVADRSWFGAVPVTNARRSLVDCSAAALYPDLLRQAAQQALRRGLVTQPELTPVEQALAPFGGLAA